MNWDSMRLARLSLAAKLLVTLFVLLEGTGYLVATANIYLQHQDADLEPGLTLDDLRRTFHGLEKEITPKDEVQITSRMLKQVQSGGKMRKFLERGGEPAIRALLAWLERGAKEADFAKPDLVQSGDASAKQVIAARCVECHHAKGGEMEDLPYASAKDAEPEYALVAVAAAREFHTVKSGPQRVSLAPMGIKELVLVTHIHILAIPAFTLIAGTLFLMTGFGRITKCILVPLPMLATLLDIGSWWLARWYEPCIYVIAASGAIFGLAFGLQILGILGSMWFGAAPSDST
jgi:mono/diheme cytochrome c family protein